MYINISSFVVVLKAPPHICRVCCTSNPFFIYTHGCGQFHTDTLTVMYVPLLTVFLCVTISADPEMVPGGLSSFVGADFCVSFDYFQATFLELRCDLTVEDTFTYPLPERAWYKDGVLLYKAVVGESTDISNEFYEAGDNSILRPGVVGLSPLTSFSDGSLILNWGRSNLTGVLPVGVTMNGYLRDIFRTLLGSWECRLNNSLGEGRAETVLIDCGEFW